jgi:hypothetical protein
VLSFALRQNFTFPELDNKDCVNHVGISPLRETGPMAAAGERETCVRPLKRTVAESDDRVLTEIAPVFEVDIAWSSSLRVLWIHISNSARRGNTLPREVFLHDYFHAIAIIFADGCPSVRHL